MLGALLAAFGLSLAAGALAGRLGRPLVAHDAPRAAYKRQSLPVPVAGSLALTLPLCAFGALPPPWLAAILAAGLLGEVDDRLGSGLRWQVKLAGQLACAAAFVVAEPGAGLGALCWLTVSMNAWNLADNSDGAACACALGAGIPLCFADGAPPGVAALAGACLAFGARNWPRAKQYLGDAGSLPLGCFFGLVSLSLVEGGTARALAPQLLVLADLVQVLVLRVALGIPPWRGDRRHLAHRLETVVPKLMVAPLLFVLAGLPVVALVSLG